MAAMLGYDALEVGLASLPEETGLASGVVDTSFMMGGALDLAVLVAASSARTDAAAVIGGVLLRPRPMSAETDPTDHEGRPALAEPA